MIRRYDELKRGIEEAIAKSGLPFCFIADLLHLYWLRADALAAQELREEKNGTGETERESGMAER